MFLVKSCGCEALVFNINGELKPSVKLCWKHKLRKKIKNLSIKKYGDKDIQGKVRGYT